MTQTTQTRHASHRQSKVQDTLQVAATALLFSFIPNAYKCASLGQLSARWARCLSAHRAALPSKLLTRGEDRQPGPASLHPGGAAAPRFKCQPKAACPPHALPSAPALPSAALSASASAAGPGLRQRSQRGQRTLTLTRRIAGALEGRLRLKTNIIWNDGFLCRCTV